MPRQKREDKVRFMRSQLYEGQLMRLPAKYKLSNIIDPASLPEPLSFHTPRPRPDSDVYDFPARYWPSPNTSLVPENMSAIELWEQCSKNVASSSSGRPSGRTDNRRRENKSNSSTTRSYNNISTCIPITNNRVHEAVVDLENLSRKEQDDRLLVLKAKLSDKDYAIIEQIVDDKRTEYIRAFCKSYTERGLGPIPRSDNPAYLARELKRRVACQENGLDWKKVKWPTIRRKHHLPARHEINVPRVEESEAT
ncbi:uncharacterized protein LOC110445989 [Mizuhopecten yessoensis]|uniref:Uncharacterized protein n=1 Tax=Mizuhopecten yessoensis TaxID=6573 RepID=A0A210QYC3_MIZYE|nr:uncharacterized protein LOC110445989 [Mizuhopecten yessoensis]OWF53757.1 hypothetical protein KP79_PYT10685 [Mizuhopecten yessoensis]